MPAIVLESKERYIFLFISNTMCEVNILKYENLNQLIGKSSSSRQYFLSLPVSIQVELHKYNNYIHTAAELHRYVDTLAKSI